RKSSRRTMKVSRGLLLGGVASAYASVGIPRWPAGAAEYTLKFATTVPVAESMSAHALQAAARVLRDTGGRLEIQVFPNSSLGGEAELLGQVRIGAIDFVQLGYLIVATVVPAAGMVTLPFLFQNHDAAWRTCDGPLGKYIEAGAAKVGIRPLR